MRLHCQPSTCNMGPSGTLLLGLGVKIGFPNGGVLNAASRVVTGTRKFDRGLGQILHDELHWLDVPDRVFFKLACSDSAPVSERPRSTVPVGLLCPGRRC